MKLIQSLILFLCGLYFSFNCRKMGEALLSARSYELGMRFSQKAWRSAFIGPLGAGIGLIVMAILNLTARK